MLIVQNLKEYVEEGQLYARTIFRQLHSWPELGGEEFKTSVIIGRELKAMGLDIRRPFPTAVVADIQGSGDKTLGFRADIDALPIAEETMVSYRSRRAGIMHACGHDMHTAVLLGAAKILCKMRSVLSCNIRLLFQPDEEGEGGALRLVEKGALQGVSQIYGFHAMPQLPAGQIGIKYGTVHGESRTFVVRIQGQQAHGAKPHLGRDAIYGAAELINLYQSILSRDLDPIKCGVIHFGKIQGGESRNVMADKVLLEGIVRGNDAAVCDLICKRMQVMATGLSRAMNLEIQVNFENGYSALINSQDCVNKIKKAAACDIVELREKSLTVDDFSELLKEVPGAYFFVGSGFKDRENAGLHTSSFQINEDCIATAIETLVRICLQN